MLYMIFQRMVPILTQYSLWCHELVGLRAYHHLLGHRIPNANPFQAGIGGGASHAPGASTFLIASTEDEANKILDKLGINGKPGARYVVSNAYMAYSIQPVFAEWDMSNEGYFIPLRQTRENRRSIYEILQYHGTKLHIFDTNGCIITACP